MREIEETPGRLIWEVLEARAFARALTDLERQERHDDPEFTVTEWVESVMEARDEWLEREFARKRGGG